MTSNGVALLLATANPGKRAEFMRLLPPDVRVITLDEVAASLPPETGTTFAENAAVKALAGANQTGLLTLADDSGLEVEALGGAPGVRSARFAGEPASDQRNRQALLEALSGVPANRRAARFVCAVALARPGQIVAEAEGRCEGAIAFSPAGRHGFGYDPIFLLPDGRTMAELAPAEKDRVSPRAVAYRGVLPAVLRELGPTRATGNRP